MANVMQLENDHGEQVSAEPAPIETNLKLTPAQVERLLLHVRQRLDDVSAEMGTSMSGGILSHESWIEKRDRWQRQYEGDFLWREAMGGIFQYSNHSINISKRYAELIKAKASDDLMGTDPFFSCMPKESSDIDEDLVREIEDWSQGKISDSKLTRVADEAILSAMIRGESVQKVTYRKDLSIFYGPATVAVDQGGQPIITPKGNYYFPKDLLIPDPQVEDQWRLRKEPGFVLPPGKAQFKSFPDLQQRGNTYEGLEVKPVYFKDFRCPLNVDNFDEADIIGHLFDDTYDRIKSQYGNIETADSYLTFYEAELKKPNINKGETDGSTLNLHIVNLVDVYVDFDANEDGHTERIWLLMDRRFDKAVWYDYMENHMPKRPFTVIHGRSKCQDRWYGTGIFESLEQKSLYIDLMFNRVNFKSSKSSSLRFVHANAIRQLKAGQQLTFGDDQIYEVTDDTYGKDHPPFYVVPSVEIDQWGMELLNLIIAAAQTEVGIVSPDDSQMSAMPSTKLATGIKYLERTGNQIMKDIQKTMSVGITGLVAMAIDCLFENMDEDEFIFSSKTQKLFTLNRDAIRTMPRQVKLMLSRSRSTETLENSTQVVSLCKDYYGLTPWLQYKLRPEYIRQLKALETPDADDLLMEVTKDQAMQFLQNQKQPAKPMAESVQIKYPQLARSEQEQLLQAQGIKPASPEELAESQAADVALQGATEAAKAQGQATGDPPETAKK